METAQILQLTGTAEFSMFSNKKEQRMLVSSMNRKLNDFLGGGLHYGMISQVYGEAGSGKTQLAMLYAIGALSRDQMVAYLATDKEIAMGRFLELTYSAMNEAQYEQKQNLFLYRKSIDYNISMQFIEESMNQIKQSQKGGLLVIDSVHALINSCFEHYDVEKDNLQRSKKQAQFVNRLRKLAKMSNCAVLLINHAADAFQNRRSSLNNRPIVPSLGPSWELNMDETIELTKRGDIRQIMVINSPKAASNVSGWFRIQHQGFSWISREGIEAD